MSKRHRQVAHDQEIVGYVDGWALPGALEIDRRVRAVREKVFARYIYGKRG